MLSPPAGGDGVEPDSDTLPFRKVLSIPREQKKDSTLALPPGAIVPWAPPPASKVGIPPRIRPPTADSSFPPPAFVASGKTPSPPPYTGPQGLPPVIQDARMESSGVKPKPPELNVDSGAVTVSDLEGTGGAFPTPPLASTAEVNLTRSTTAERKNPYQKSTASKEKSTASKEKSSASKERTGSRESDRGGRATIVLVVAGFIAMTLAVGLGVGTYFALKAALGW